MTSPLPSQLTRLADQISTIIVGKRPQIEDCLACLLAGGHLLIEDLPGVGKTTLAHALAVSLGLRFSRMQFTADLAATCSHPVSSAMCCPTGTSTTRSRRAQKSCGLTATAWRG